MFARQFKPVINAEAKDLLILNYGHLRQRDSGTTGKSTWRITVRQLESMVRLSEAMAKLECSQEVAPKHVKEAYRLLNKSIIRVEQPDIHLDDDDDAAMAEIDIEPVVVDATTPPPNDENAPPSNTAPTDPETADHNTPSSPVLKKKKMTVTFEEYKSISNMLILYMRNEEARIEAEETESEGLKRSDLVGWYLEQIADMIESEEELIERKSMIEKVIDRLVYHVSSLTFFLVC